MASNPYEGRARAKKAQALFTVARHNHLTAEQVANGADVRTALVTLSGVREPSDETWRLVVLAIASAERQEARYRATRAA